MSKSPAEDKSDLKIPRSDVVRFVRQVSHDLRNDLNAAELQAAFIGELTGDNAELKEEVKRLREMILKLAVTLQGLSTALGQVNLNVMPYGVGEFVEDLRAKIDKDLAAQSGSLKWEVKVGNEKFEIDPQLLQQAFLELFRNAFQHGRGQGDISILAKIDNGKFVFAMREPKSEFSLATENWGREPFSKISQGHYGLGLHRVRLILEGHGGSLEAKHDAAASELITTVKLPVSEGGK